MSEIVQIRTIRLAHHFKKDKINVSHIEKPYGEFSDPVVKIQVEESDRIVGEVEIPYENIEELIAALRKSADIYNETPRSDVHDELIADTGGGA